MEKQNETTIYQKEQEVSTLTSKLSLTETEVEKLETDLKHWKTMAGEGESAKDQGEGLTRKVGVLEEELEKTEKELRTTLDK